MSKHPNATAAGASTGAAALIAWLASLAGLTLPDPVAILAGGVLVVAVLAIGRDGLRTIIVRLWRGTPPKRLVP